MSSKNAVRNVVNANVKTFHGRDMPIKFVAPSDADLGHSAFLIAQRNDIAKKFGIPKAFIG